MMLASPTPQSKKWSQLETQSKSLDSIFSCTLNRHSENAVIKANIIAELCANRLVRSDDTASEDSTKILNRLGVQRADDILSLGMVNCAAGKFRAEAIKGGV